MANGFNSSNRNRMGSNASTTQAQGGGDKKAGFPYQVGRSSWASIAFPHCKPSTEESNGFSLTCMQFTVNPDVRSSRPVDVRPHVSMR
jgi:hypothetical protein